MNLVKHNLSIYLPKVIEFIGEEEFPWDQIENRFDKLIDRRFSQAKGDSIIVETSIFDQIISIKKGDNAYNGLMDYYNKLFHQLNLLLNKEEKKLMFNTIRSLLISFDLKYLNYLGELSVLYKLKKSNKFSLLDVEKVLPNGKSIDFDLMIENSNMRVLIEVLNIQVNPQKVENDSDKIEIFINGRITNKLADKKKNLDEDWNVHLVPVIWAGHEELEIYHQYFRNNALDIPLSYEPLAFLTFYDQFGNYLPKFGSISALFDS